MLQIKDLDVAYGQSQVIRGLNLEAEPNQTIAVMGRNGMGKTTLFKALIGILPARGGRISVDSIDVTAMPSHRRVENGIAYVPQGRMIFPALTVRENIETGLETVRSKTIRRNLRALPGAVRDAQPQGRQPLGWSAAATGHRARWSPNPACCCSTSRPRAFSRPSSRTSRGY